MAISMILMAAVASLSLYTGRSFAMLANYVDLDNTSRTALDILTRDIRQVRYVDPSTSSHMVFTDYDLQPLEFIYNQDRKTLTRIKGGEVKVLLYECDELSFNMYQRNPIAGTFDLVGTSNNEQCLAVDVSWICSRKILGQRVNTESVQTARIVIRKQKEGE
jgi:hypothetical protein